jgi:hypothetical protein
LFAAYFWLWDGSGIIYQQDSDGDENYHLYLVPLKTLLDGTGAKPKVQDLTPFKGEPGYTAVRKQTPAKPLELLVSQLRLVCLCAIYM